MITYFQQRNKIKERVKRFLVNPRNRRGFSMKVWAILLILQLGLGFGLLAQEKTKIKIKPKEARKLKLNTPYQLLTLEEEKKFSIANPEQTFKDVSKALQNQKLILSKFRGLNPLIEKDTPQLLLKKFKLPLSPRLAFFTWLDQGVVTPAKNQNPYGTCWAFASVGVLEAVYYMRHREILDLSEQDLINCHCRRCDGNNPEVEYKAKEKVGLRVEAENPYKGDGNKPYCKIKNCDPCLLNEQTPYRIDLFSVVNPAYSEIYPPQPPPVNQIKQALLEHGPLLVKMHIPSGSKIGAHKGAGVFTETIPLIYEPKDQRNCGAHIVSIIGWDDNKKAWHVKNSWGTGWGVDGNGWVAYGSNNIGMGALWYRAAAPDFHVTAVWQNDQQEEIQAYGWSYDQYRKKYDQLWQQGWRLHLLENTVKNGQTLYSAVWRKSSVPELQVYGWDFQDYKNKYTELWKKGWRLYLLNNYVLDGKVKYTAAWRESTTPELTTYNADYQSYRKQYDELWKMGWRLYILNNYILEGKVKYTAVWRKSTTPEYQVYGWDYQDYRKKYDEIWPKGWRLKILNNYMQEGKVKYTAVWKQETYGEIQVYSWYYDDFRKKDEELRQTGWRLTQVNTY